MALKLPKLTHLQTIVATVVVAGVGVKLATLGVLQLAADIGIGVGLAYLIGTLVYNHFDPPAAPAA